MKNSKYICGSCGEHVKSVKFNEQKDIDECKDCQTVDLFERHDLLPAEIQAILDKYAEIDNDYTNCQSLLAEMEENGYTFDYGLCGTPFNLRIMENQNPEKKILSIDDIDLTELQDAHLEYLGLTPENTNVVFNEGKPNMLIASVSKEKGIVNRHKAMVITITGQGICDDEFDRMIIDKETLKEIAYTTDYLYTNFGIDIHSHTLKNTEPFKNLKIKRTN